MTDKLLHTDPYTCLPVCETLLLAPPHVLVPPRTLLDVLKLALRAPAGPLDGPADVAELGAAPAADVAAGRAVLDHGEAPVAPAPARPPRDPLHELLHVRVPGALHRVLVRGPPALHAGDVLGLAPRPPEGEVDPRRGDEQAAVWRGAVVPLADGHRVLLSLLLVQVRQGAGGVLEDGGVVDGGHAAALGRPAVFWLEGAQDELVETLFAVVVLAGQSDEMFRKEVVITACASAGSTGQQWGES